MTGRELPGLCDASRKVLAFPPPAVAPAARPRWLDPNHHMLRRSLLLALTFAAGFAAALITT